MLTFNKHKGKVAAWGLILLSPAAFAGMESLDETELAGISGQSGITMELDLAASAESISYFDDGNGIHLEGFRLGSTSDTDAPARHVIKVDILEDAALNLDFLVEDRRIEFSDIRLAGAPGISMGGVFFEHSLDGFLQIRQGGAVGGSGYTFDTAFTVTGGRMGYETNGNAVFLDDISMDFQVLGMTLDVSGDGLLLNSPSIVGKYTVGDIRYTKNPGNLSAGPRYSYGSLSGDFDLSSEVKLRGGGRFGTEGVRIDGKTTINSANFIYRDGAQSGHDGNALAFRDITGFLEADDLRLDVFEDWKGRPALALTVDSLSGEFNIGKIQMGASTQSIGSVNLDFLFQDQTINGRRYTNAIYMQGGGNAAAGPQGLRLATEWSLKNADLSYVDDGNRVIFSGLQSWGRGDITLDVTRNQVRNGTRFYDGLRIGFEDVNGGYRLNGLRVGDKNSDLQGGTELLLALSLYPAYDFELDGQVTIGAGGASGEGLTINSDIRIRNGNAAFLAAPYSESGQKGLWASDLSYDQHVRDMTIDVTSEGLAIITGEAWSTMDIGNLRIGDKDSGGSFGRFVIQKYEKGSSMTIIPGGAQGDEGLRIRMKQIFARAVSDTKRNALTWETDSGMKLVLNDIHTSDGAGGGNSYGMRTELSVDVAPTRVVNKQTGSVSRPLGFAVNARTRFKELSIESVDLVHPSGGSQTVLYGLSLQNVDLKANLTATPIK